MAEITIFTEIDTSTPCRRCGGMKDWEWEWVECSFCDDTGWERFLDVRIETPLPSVSLSRWHRWKRRVGLEPSLDEQHGLIHDIRVQAIERRYADLITRYEELGALVNANRASGATHRT